MEELFSQKKAGICGILGPVVIFLFIAVSIFLHPWFNFSSYALSDLGALGKSYFMVFGLGMIFSGVLFLVFSFGLEDLTNTKIGSVGSKIFLLGAFSMIFVGVFPKGSTIHTYVTIVMGISYFFGLIFIGIDQFMEESTKSWGVFIFSTLFLTIAGAVFVLPIPSVIDYAIPETLGILLLSNFSIVFSLRILNYF